MGALCPTGLGSHPGSAPLSLPSWQEDTAPRSARDGLAQRQAPVCPCVCCSSSRPLPAANLFPHHAWPWCRSSAENQGRLPSGLRRVQVNPKQVCVRDAKREAQGRRQAKGDSPYLPGGGQGLILGPPTTLPRVPSHGTVGIYDPSFCGKTLQRERLALSSMCFCVKQRYHCFQQIPWGLNE